MFQTEVKIKKQLIIINQFQIKITNDGKEGKVLHVKQGEAFCQSIILQYFKVDNYIEGVKRNGGVGSTNTI